MTQHATPSKYPHPRPSVRRWLSHYARRVARELGYTIPEQAPGFNIHDPKQFRQLLEEANVELIPSMDDVLRDVIARYMKLPRYRKTTLNHFAETLAHSRDPIAEPLHQALATNPTSLPKRIWESRSDLREAFPVGLTYLQRRLYAVWLLTVGRAELDLQPGQVLWTLFELDEHPTEAIVESYLRHPQWQEAVPDGLTQAGWPRLMDWLGTTYELQRSWLATLEPADRPSATNTLGVNILGYFRYACGLREEALAIGAALETEGVAIACRDIPSGIATTLSSDLPLDSLENYPITVIPTAASNVLEHLYDAAGLHPRSGVYRIVFWAWELQSFPVEYLEQSSLVDEVWALSEYCATAIREVTDRPVYAMPTGVPVPCFEPLPRSHFGLSDDRFIFYFSFDMGSVMQRKNPLGVLQAFRTAFSVNEPVDLVIKVMRGTSQPHDFQLLQTEVERVGAILIDRVMTRKESFALMAQCDCYVSLHRAEGLGLTVAEAMHLGKPIICTNYSGPQEFIDAETGLLIPYTLVPIGEGIGTYPSSAHWAEPDLHEAAQAMRWITEHPIEAQEMGSRAKVAAATRLDTTLAARRIVDRIRTVYEGLQ